MLRTATATATALAAVGLGAACSSTTAPDVKPTSATISVEGTTPVPLQLVVSTDFYEYYDTDIQEIVEVYNSSDTTLIDLPFERQVPLSDLGSIVVTLTNFDDQTATVRMRVHLDSGQQPYDQSATMSQGGTLRYVFTYTPTVLQ